MKYILLSFLFSWTAMAGTPVGSGDKITVKRFNNQTFTVGDIKHSLLSLVKFQELMGDCWVKMEGQEVSSSDYSSIMGKTHLPDARGRFARTIGGNAPALGETQEDDNKEHSHGVKSLSGNYAHSGGSYDHNYTVGNYALAHYVAVREAVSSGGVEARPKNYGVNTFVKINHQCN